MKKNLMKSFLLLSVCALGIGGLSSCGGGTKNDDHVLNIVCLNKGYGREWIDELVKVWEKDNPGYTVNLTAESSSEDLISKHLYSKNNVDDLYISNSKAWKTYALKGKLLELDDFLQEEVDGMNVLDKINDEYKKSIYYNGHTYRLPWTSGVPGIYYNAKMFEENNWEIPTTFDELLTLCDTIKNAGVGVGTGGKITTTVKPFVYTGENMDYFDYSVFTWWAQLAGKTNVDNYLKYESADTFSNSNPAFKALGEALKMWWKVFGNKDNYVAESKGWTNHLAQQSFYNGYAAMMINCDWLYNETLKYTNNNQFRDGFELKIMQTPAASSAVTDKISYIVGEDQYFAIPATTIKADLAKSFLKLLVSDKGVTTFAEKAHGTLAYKTSGKVTTTDEYTNSLFEYLDNAEETFTNWSNSPLFLNNVIDVWTENALAPYARIFNAPAVKQGEDPMKPVDDYMKEVSDNAKAQWSKWLKNAGQ